MQNDSKKAMNLGLIVSGIFGLIVVIIFFMGESDHSKWEEGASSEDSAELGEEAEDKAADEPDPPADEKKEEPAAEGGEAAAEGGEAEATE